MELINYIFYLLLLAGGIYIFFYFFYLIMLGSPKEKYEKHNIPVVYTVMELKVIPQGRWMSDLFVITKEGEVINLKYDSETFAKLKIGDKISISEGTFDDKINIIKREL